MIGMLNDVDHGTYHATNFSERYAGYPESGFQPCDTPVLDLSSKHTALTTRVHITPCCHLSDFEGSFSGKKNSPVQKSIFVMYWYVVKKVVQFQMFVVVGFIARCFHLSWRISSESRGLSHPPVDPRAARLMVKAARCRLAAQCLTGCQTGWR